MDSVCTVRIVFSKLLCDCALVLIVVADSHSFEMIKEWMGLYLVDFASTAKIADASLDAQNP